MDLHFSHEWENVSLKDPKNGILLEYDGNQLCRLCEELSQLPNTRKFESCAT